MTGPRVVALGGGHGLSATLQALREITEEITAVVTVADDGGSSGRLREQFDVLPPGDLRMALSALCGDDEWGRTWSEVLQYRFQGAGDLRDHAMGNLLIVALWQLMDDDPVTGLSWVSRLLRSKGTVLPMSTVPLQIEARVADAHDGTTRVVCGQHAVASTTGRVLDVALQPAEPPACTEAVKAVRQADWVLLGPGSWFTSVIPHLLVPELRDALLTTDAHRALLVNLAGDHGETFDFTPVQHLSALRAHAPKLRLDIVLVDSEAAEGIDPRPLHEAAAAYGARVVCVDLRSADDPLRHDPHRLAAALGPLVNGGREEGGEQQWP